MLETMIFVFETIGILSVMTSVALLHVAQPGLWSVFELLLLEHAVLFYKAYLAWSIPETPEWIRAHYQLGNDKTLHEKFSM